MIAVTQKNECGHQQSIPMGEGLDLQHLLEENRSLRWERNHYKSLLDRARAREQSLKQEIEQFNARIRYLEKRLYGHKSEKKRSRAKSNSSATSSSDGESKRSRGHQPGSPGHGRRDYSHLPVQEETFELDEAVCPHCGCPYQEDAFLGTEDSELIEVEVSAYRRSLNRFCSRSSRRIKQKDTCMPMRLVGKSLSSSRASRATVGICGFLFRTVPSSIFWTQAVPHPSWKTT